MALYLVVVLLLINSKYKVCNGNEEDTNDMLGFSNMVSANNDWVDPMDMGLQPTTTKTARGKIKIDESSSMDLDASKLHNQQYHIDKLKEEIATLMTNISLLQQENYQLNKTTTSLSKNLTNLCNCSHTDQLRIGNLELGKSNGKSEAAKATNDKALEESKRRIRTEVPFLLRYVRVLTRRLKLNTKDNEKLPWKLENIHATSEDRVLRYSATLRLSEKDVNVLQALSRKENPDISHYLYDLDHILSNFITDPRPETTEEMEKALNIDYTALLFQYFPSENDLIWIIIIISCTVLSVMLYTGRLNLWRFLGLLFLVSTVWHWTRMYKKALADKHTTLSKAKHVPKECSPQSMSWSHFMFDTLFTRQDKCQEYFEALMIDPLLEVTPTMALAETFTAFIVQPLEHLGRHIGKFFNALLQETSWLSSPVILTFVFIAILLCLVMIFNYRFRLPFFLGSFEPRTSHNDSLNLERKEQTTMIVELRKELVQLQQALQEANPSEKPVHLTSLPNSSSRIEVLQSDQVEQQFNKEIENTNLSNQNNTSMCDVDAAVPRTISEPDLNLMCTNSITNFPIIGNAESQSQSSLDKMKPFDLLTETPVSKIKFKILAELGQEDSLPDNDSMTQYDSYNTEDTDCSYRLSPMKKLIVRKNDKDPSETDFEWITEILTDKIKEVEDQPIEKQNENYVKEPALEFKENDLLDKAKCVFKEVFDT